MTKTIYILTHVDAPNEEILNQFICLDSLPQFFWELDIAQEHLEKYHEQGLEYDIRTITIKIS